MENIWMFLQQTAAGGLCALFLLLLQRIFRNLLSPRWQYGIWGVLVLRLMIPVGARGRSTVLDVWPWLEAARAGAELALDSAYSSPWTLSLPRGPLPILPAEPPRSLTDWLFLLYLAGALGLALWYLGCALRLSLRVSRGVPVEGPRRAAIDAVAQRYQLPRPRRVVECRWERSPFLTGFLAPALVLPMGWEPDEKVILHELLHLKHRDLWAGWLTAALRCLHWCDPLLWLAFDKADNDREALCDQRVLERLEGEDRRDYGRVLLSMADSRAVRVPGATTMANGARAIQARIQKERGIQVEVMVYGDGAFKDPIGGIWELADPVVSPAYTAGLAGKPNELKLKFLADNDFADLSGDELKAAIQKEIKSKHHDLVGNMSSEGTTPRQYTDLLGSLCDLTSGSGDKGTPFIVIQNYFTNYAE